MSGAPSGLAGRAQALRQAFDSAFAQEAVRDTTVLENLLALRLGSEPYALRLSQIGGLYLNRRITPAPGAVAGLLGIAGFRGAILPVYDLAVLLGHAASEAPRWLVIAADAPVALAFETFVGHLRIPSEAIMPRDAGGPATQLIREFVSTEDEGRPLVHLPAVLDAIRAQLPATARA